MYYIDGWWCATRFGEITGNIALEIGEQQYMNAMDNGRFCLGPKHDAGTF